MQKYSWIFKVDVHYCWMKYNKVWAIVVLCFRSILNIFQIYLFFTMFRIFLITIISNNFSFFISYLELQPFMKRKKEYECEFCGYKAPNVFIFESHIRIHTGQKLLKCKSCDYNSTRNDHMIRHMRTHTNENSFEWELCDYCSARNVKWFILHMITHTGEKTRKCGLYMWLP